jgi:5-methyltetrahydrofolate--homocysteine methyltransferase
MPSWTPKDGSAPQDLVPHDVEDLCQSTARIDLRYRHFCQTHHFLGETFPNIDADFGPGSMAGHLGSNIVFRDDTVRFEPCVDHSGRQPSITFGESKPKARGRNRASERETCLVTEL